MNPEPPIPGSIPAATVVGDRPEDTVMFSEMAQEAIDYLESFRWCHKVRELWFSGGVGGIVAVFCAEIDHDPEVDERLWTVVGDVPSAYMPLEVGASAKEVVEAYVELVEEWISAVEAGELAPDVFPLRSPKDSEHIAMLRNRLKSLTEFVIPNLMSGAEALPRSPPAKQ